MARCLLTCCLDTFTEDINYAAESLAIAAEGLLNQATSNHDLKAAEEAHAEMWRAAAILEYLTGIDVNTVGEELAALQGVHFLMAHAIELLNAALAGADEAGVGA